MSNFVEWGPDLDLVCNLNIVVTVMDLCIRCHVRAEEGTSRFKIFNSRRDYIFLCLREGREMFWGVWVC